MILLSIFNLYRKLNRHDPSSKHDQLKSKHMAVNKAGGSGGSEALKSIYISLK